MALYIDVSNFLNAGTTGIQRVVKEIVVRIIKNRNDYILMDYDPTRRTYYEIDSEKFIDFYYSNVGTRSKVVTKNEITIEDMRADDVYFEIDSCWNNKNRRSTLYKRLKEKNIKIVVHVYDIIPVLFPQYCHSNTLIRFLNYIGATLEYADNIIVNTESTANDIKELANKVGVQAPKIEVIPLGSDFKNDELKEEILGTATKITEKGKYIFMVGTIEPRKNHQFVLDMFDKYLKNTDISLVFAGRIGWNVEELTSRMKKYEESYDNFYFINAGNDTTINYLYNNASLVLVPSIYEGFGLPIIEALEKKVPVIASDISVFKDVAGDFCDYFSLDDVDDLGKLVMKYINNENNIFENKVEQLKSYKITTWDESYSKFNDFFESIVKKNKYTVKSTEQIVILTADSEKVCNALGYIENMMLFIKEIVICCPKKIYEQISSSYDGNLKIDYLFDEALLGNHELPKDHATRNFLLRCLAVKEDIIKDTFIMFDDDYKPLVNIDENVFVQNGKYKAYYFYELSKWVGDQSNPSSYDLSMHKAYEFLMNNNLPCLQYSSHMPQIIDKRIWLELMDEFENITEIAVDEWSTYFNYAINRYPSMYRKEIYKTLCWPGDPTDWDLMFEPSEYLFENSYPEMYDKDGVLSGLSQKWNENSGNENLDKIKIRNKIQVKHNLGREGFNAINKLYSKVYNKKYDFTILKTDKAIKLNVPKFYMAKQEFCNRIRFEVLGWEENEEFNLTLGYKITYVDGTSIRNELSLDVDRNLGIIELPIVSPDKAGDYKLTIKVSNEKGVFIEKAIDAYIYENII